LEEQEKERRAIEKPMRIPRDTKLKTNIFFDENRLKNFMEYFPPPDSSSNYTQVEC